MIVKMKLVTESRNLQYNVGCQLWSHGTSHKILKIWKNELFSTEHQHLTQSPTG